MLTFGKLLHLSYSDSEIQTEIKTEFQTKKMLVQILQVYQNSKDVLTRMEMVFQIKTISVQM
ncbi:hypothetical protein D3C72_2311670 [compost metagenome]